MFKRAYLALCLCCAASPVFGFALLGPYTDWMTSSNGYRQPGQLGGPMALGEEYRWNLPVITYGFDPEFVEYFGPEGIAAVEAAIALLTNLPPASEINLDDFDTRPIRANQDANALGLLDVKSVTLHFLLGQFGLAPPTASMWTLGQPDAEGYSLLQRNYDPISLSPTNVVNDVAWGYELHTFPDGWSDARERVLDPLTTFPWTAVADGQCGQGSFWLGLSRDDVGGWRYLYRRENVKVEPLPPAITVANGIDRPEPDVALRCGVEKISFLRLRWNTNRAAFDSVTNVFGVTYLMNGITRTQHVQRIASTPDILFQARDFGGIRGRTTTGDYYFLPTGLTHASDTAHWLNLSMPDAGPGIIPPGAKLTFNKLGRYSEVGGLRFYQWGSFDESFNDPVMFLGNERVQSLPMDNYIQREGTNAYFTSVMLGTVGAVYQIDSSSNLVYWTPLTTVTNDNWDWGYFSFRDKVDDVKKFYRATRQD